MAAILCGPDHGVGGIVRTQLGAKTIEASLSRCYHLLLGDLERVGPVENRSSKDARNSSSDENLAMSPSLSDQERDRNSSRTTPARRASRSLPSAHVRRKSPRPFQPQADPSLRPADRDTSPSKGQTWSGSMQHIRGGCRLPETTPRDLLPTGSHGCSLR
jgi:hypothetical protein